MGPIELLLVRHGQSEGNVAWDLARAHETEVVDIGVRDADVPLSPLGREQAAALGRWLVEVAPEQRPEAVWCSSYLRARQTATIALAAAGLDLPVRVDERLRDRELGILDQLTELGVRTRFPTEDERRRVHGKFYYRPPGGESWTDLALRVRSVLADLDVSEPGHRILVVAHDAITLVFRYVCERLDEQALREIFSTTSIANAGVTRLDRPRGVGLWSLGVFNETGHLR